MDRRGFLKSILATGVAPYVVTTAGVLMPVRTHSWVEAEIPQSTLDAYYKTSFDGGATWGDETRVTWVAVKPVLDIDAIA